MGFGGISIWQLLIIAVIIILLFGTKKLRGVGSDLGSALKGFRGAMNESEEAQKKDDAAKLAKDEEGRVIDTQATAEKKEETKV